MSSGIGSDKIGSIPEEDAYALVSDRIGSDPFRKKGYKLRYRTGKDRTHSGRGCISFGIGSDRIGSTPEAGAKSSVSDRIHSGKGCISSGIGSDRIGAVGVENV